MAGNVAFYCY